MKEPIFLKKDRRFKKGNIKIERDGLRGHPETISLDPAKLPQITDFHNRYWFYHDKNVEYLKLQLNPPIVVSRELGEKLKEVL